MSRASLVCLNELLHLYISSTTDSDSPGLAFGAIFLFLCGQLGGEISVF